MFIILTLLCRNEEDIIKHNIDYHLKNGVSFIIATDNGSTDGTTDILRYYESLGLLHYIFQPEYTHDQSKWVTHMAHLACSKYKADWILHCDADEFWCTSCNNLPSFFQSIPLSTNLLYVKRNNFIPPLIDDYSPGPFFRKQIYRESNSKNFFGDKLPDKVCHRSLNNISVTDGNHDLVSKESILSSLTPSELDIVHYPVRSLHQFTNKIKQGVEALNNNKHLSPLT